MVQDNKMLGTYDNAITNAAVLSLMVEDCFPVLGDMHSNKGVFVLCESYENYRIALKTIVVNLSKDMFNGIKT